MVFFVVVCLFYSPNRSNFLKEKMRPLWLVALFALLNANITLKIWLVHLISSDGRRAATDIKPVFTLHWYQAATATT